METCIIINLAAVCGGGAGAGRQHPLCPHRGLSLPVSEDGAYQPGYSVTVARHERSHATRYTTCCHQQWAQSRADQQTVKPPVGSSPSHHVSALQSVHVSRVSSPVHHVSRVTDSCALCSTHTQTWLSARSKSNCSRILDFFLS